MNREGDPSLAFSSLAGNRRRFTFNIWQMMRIILVVGCVFGLWAALGRLVNAPNDASRRSACVNNLKQIGLAMHNYHAVYGAFPPAYVADNSGRAMHSWRVLLLPFLDNPPFLNTQALYEQYNFDESWDGPNNITLLGKMPAVFECPGNHIPGSGTSTWTSYVVIGGPGTMFPGPTSIALDQVTDGPSDTILAVEVANFRIPWTKPQDLDLRTMSLQINDRDNPSVSSNHPRWTHVACGDGSIRLVRQSMTAIHLRAHATIAGRESPSSEW
jgi:hypothetical protein